MRQFLAPVLILAASSLMGSPAAGQDAPTAGSDPELPSTQEGSETPNGLEQALVDSDALVIASQVTTRCALYDSGTEYLSPLADAAVRVRIEELGAALASGMDDFADRVSAMRAEANAVPCGHEGLEPFLSFARQVAGDVTAIALLAWDEIDIDACSYFADDDFLVAVDRAKSEAGDFAPEPDADRQVYLESLAGAWVDVFARNCHNLAFDPTLTLPGQIALALPRSPA